MQFFFFLFSKENFTFKCHRSDVTNGQQDIFAVSVELILQIIFWLLTLDFWILIPYK